MPNDLYIITLLVCGRYIRFKGELSLIESPLSTISMARFVMTTVSGTSFWLAEGINSDNQFDLTELY